MPGVLRYYNISYRVLNISDSEVVELSVPAATTTHLIDGLTGLLLCEINVTAYTVDVGPAQTIRVITDEGGRSLRNTGRFKISSINPWILSLSHRFALERNHTDSRGIQEYAFPS